MNISLFIARRLQLKGTKRDTSSSSTIIAVAGVAIAIIVMALTLSVVLGFKNQIREKVTGFESQITINPATDYTIGEVEHTISFSDTLKNIILPSLANCDSATISLALKQPGIIKTDENFIGLVFKGIDNTSNNSFIKGNLIEGSFPDFGADSCKNDIVVSSTTASALNLSLGNRVNTYFFSDGNIRARKFNIVGIYNSNFGEYDKLIAYAPLKTLQRIANLDSISGTSIEINGFDNDNIYNKSYELQSAINQAVYSQQLKKIYSVSNVYNSGAMYFNWLDLLDMNVVVILILMSCVSAITLISCLFIIILERVRTIGLLKSLGATNTQIKRVFIYMTQRLVLRGMLLGNIISLAFIYLQYYFHIIPLDPEAYYLNFVPVEINWLHIILLNIGVITISSLILILPSHIVSKISPAQTMKYE